MYRSDITGAPTDDCTIVRVYLWADSIRHEHADGADHDDDERADCWPETVPAGTWAAVR